MALPVDDISHFPSHIQAQIRKKYSDVEKTFPSSKPKNNKFRNKPVVARGMHFQSQKELRRFEYLMLRQRAGEITDLRLQVDFTLQEAYTDCNGKRVRAIRYKADFTYKENGVLVVEDTKTRVTQTSTYIVKKKMMKDRFNIDIVEI